VITDPAGSLNTVGGGSVSGTPSGYVQDPTVTDASFEQFGGMTWEELTSLATIVLPGGSITGTGPRLNGVGACDTSHSLNWGDPSNPNAPCGNYFPIIYVQADANIQSGGSGQGILLVDGDLDLRGNFDFAGIIIIQGAIGVQGGGTGAPRVSGGVIARNSNLSNTVTTGSSLVQNSRCAVNRAVMNNSSLTQVTPIGMRSWVDLTGASF
jgi:hypothetical protein